MIFVLVFFSLVGRTLLIVLSIAGIVSLCSYYRFVYRKQDEPALNVSSSSVTSSTPTAVPVTTTAIQTYSTSPIAVNTPPVKKKDMTPQEEEELMRYYMYEAMCKLDEEEAKARQTRKATSSQPINWYRDAVGQVETDDEYEAEIRQRLEEADEYRHELYEQDRQSYEQRRKEDDAFYTDLLLLDYVTR